MNIAVIGSGNIGGTLARRWAAAGHRVAIGARDPAKADLLQLVGELGGAARAESVGDAVGSAEAVLFAVPGSAMAETVAGLGKTLNGKLVFDATNNIGAPTVNSLAIISQAAPEAAVYRAFNIYGFENFANPVVAGVQADLFFVGPDGSARQTAERLISDVGLNPVWLGGADHVELIDQFLRVWFTLAFEQKRGRRMAFKLLWEQP
jgi:predicted dinucleotide-binding enzyme